MLVHGKIRDLRKSKGMTQTFVAQEVGMSAQSYNMKESGERSITAVELAKISKVLDVPMEYFFEEKLHVKCNENSELRSVNK